MNEINKINNDNKEVVEIPLKMIRTDKELQNRDVLGKGWNEEADKKREKLFLDELRRDIKRRGQIEPVVLVSDTNIEGESFYWMVSGHHRLHALRELGWKTIKAVVHSGGFKKAWELSRQANMHVIQPMSAKAKSQNVWEALISPVSDLYRNMSNRQVSVMLGVSHPLVGKMKKVANEKYNEMKEIGQSCLVFGEDDYWGAVKRKWPYWACARSQTQRNINPEKFYRDAKTVADTIDFNMGWTMNVDENGDDANTLYHYEVRAEALAELSRRYSERAKAMKQK